MFQPCKLKTRVKGLNFTAKHANRVDDDIEEGEEDDDDG